MGTCSSVPCLCVSSKNRDMENPLDKELRREVRTISTVVMEAFHQNVALSVPRIATETAAVALKLPKGRMQWHLDTTAILNRIDEEDLEDIVVFEVSKCHPEGSHGVC